MSGRIVFHDDAVARGFEPFALTRPLATLVSGILPVAARWQRLGAEPAGFAGAGHLADFDEDLPAAPRELPPGTIIANSRFAPALGVSLDAGDGLWTSGGRVVAARIDRETPADLPDGGYSLESLGRPGGHARNIEGWWHDEVWDYLRHLPEIMAADILAVAGGEGISDLQTRASARPTESAILGTHPILVESSATVEPFVVFDASAGPILIDAGAMVHSFTRINGPCYIGRNATVMGGDISGCSIGTVSKIRGEISGSIVLGYSNKGHDGFVGNSYFGRWVNLGAGTVTSNLKNTYGAVSLWTPTGVRPTGMQFLGTLFGDHVKTGIGTKLTTGTVLGAGANVFGSEMPPKAVAPFSWGDGEPYDLYQVDKFLATAATVMGRRKMELSERARRQLTASFENRWSVA